MQTTVETWAVDGVILNTLAFNIETLEGRLRMPQMRGADIVIPYAEGERFVPKVAGPRVLTLRMWVQGADDDGHIPTNRQAEFEKNWRTLHTLLFQPGRQFILTKKFYDSNGALKTASALGQYVGGLDPTMLGRFAAKFTVDIKLANPYFYDAAYTTINLVNGHQNVNIPGDAPTKNIKVTFNGARVKPRVINWTTGDYLEYDRAAGLLTDTRVEIDVPNWQAFYFPVSGPAQDGSGFIAASGGSPMWFSANHGINDIELASNSGIGTTQLQVKGAWL